MEGDKILLQPGVLNLGAVWKIVRRRKVAFFGVMATVLILASLYLHVAPRLYSVRVEIVPTSQNGRPLGRGLSALSSLAGLSLGRGGSSQFGIFVQSLQSPVAAERLAKTPWLMHHLFPQMWSKRERRWREPPSGTRSIKSAIKSAIGFYVAPWRSPSTYDVYQYLQRNLAVDEDAKSGVVTLEIDSAHPKVATKLLVTLITDINDFLRKRALMRARSNIRYLSKKLSQVTIAEYRQALAEDLADQEKASMMASSPVPFVAEVLGPPLVSSQPVAPSPIAVMAAAVLLGIFFGTLASIALEHLLWPVMLQKVRSKLPLALLSKARTRSGP